MLRNMIRRLGEYAGKCPVLVTVMAFLWHHDQDVKAREAQAWDSILNHQWEPSPSNRAEALSTLITDGVPIAGAPLGPVRFQPQLDLSGCHTLFGVPLFWCRPALMKDAYMEWATLTAVNLKGAHLEHAHLKGVYLLPDSTGNPARLDGAFLTGAEFDQATLLHTSLRGATLDDLTSFDGARLDETDFTGARGLTAKHLDRACICSGRAPKLPDTLKYDLEHRQNPPEYCCCAEDRRPQCLSVIRSQSSQAPHE